MHTSSSGGFNKFEGPVMCYKSRSHKFLYIYICVCARARARAVIPKVYIEFKMQFAQNNNKKIE